MLKTMSFSPNSLYIKVESSEQIEDTRLGKLEGEAKALIEQPSDHNGPNSTAFQLAPNMKAG
ncbi:hypothetical protein F7731_02305 [Cytobacillus depressus]|uniref:Uncharacterized protein n=1 Tax=Cytobacillus depressus TaxID=1602942 RepID=A0A6L3VCL2_9BACI|nr:hypothetical protein F7731_02305 [Cytobacillus depressus]